MTGLFVSIVFKPSEEGIQELKILRNTLLDYFTVPIVSALSDLEILACDFEIATDQLDAVHTTLTELLRYEYSQYIYFDNYSISKIDGKVSFMPTSQSKGYLLEKTRKIFDKITPFSTLSNRYDPELPLREFFPSERLSEVVELQEFKVIDFDFFCSSVFLKVQDEKGKKCSQISELKFGNERNFGLEKGQFKLF